MQRDRLFSGLFFVILGVHLYAGEIENPGWVILSKPLLLSTLITWFVLVFRRHRNPPFGYFILGALVFSLAGDVLLLFQEFGDYFIAGLGAFLIAHLLYIAAFTKTYLVNHEIKLLKKYGWVTLVIVAYAWFFFNAIDDFLGSMIGPVLVYTMVICLMLMIALNRFKKVSKESFLWIAAGALLFVASDSLLAWNKFVRELDYSHILIMLTYGLAQYGITKGAIIQLQEASPKSIS
jgi:uncharacterized membrane protein YhhN